MSHLVTQPLEPLLGEGLKAVPPANQQAVCLFPHIMRPLHRAVWVARSGSALPLCLQRVLVPAPDQSKRIWARYTGTNERSQAGLVLQNSERSTGKELSQGDSCALSTEQGCERGFTCALSTE